MDRFIFYPKKDYLKKMESFIENKDYYGALDYVDSIEKQGIDMVWVYITRARIYTLLNMLDTSIVWYQKANYLYPDDQFILEELARNYSDLDNYTKAIEIYSRLEELGKTDFHTICDMTYCFMKLDMFEEANIYLDQALDLNPTDIWALNQKGFCLEMVNELEEALNFYVNHIEELQDKQPMLQRIVILNHKLKLYDELEYINQLDQDDFYHYYLSLYYSDNQEYNKALHALLKCGTLSEEYFFELTDIYEKLSMNKSMIFTLEEAIETYPNQILFYKRLIIELGEGKESWHKTLLAQVFEKYEKIFGLDEWVSKQYVFYYLYDKFDLHKAKYYLDCIEDEEDKEPLLLEYYDYKGEGYENYLQQIALERNFYYMPPVFDFNQYQKIDIEGLERVYDFFEGKAYFETSDQAGYIDEHGKVLFYIDHKDETFRQESYMYKNGKAIVGRNKLFGLIDEHGKLIEEEIYDEASYLKDGFILSNSNSTILYDHGKRYFYTEYRGRYIEGLMSFEINGLYGYKDIDSNVVIDAKYQYTKEFHDGYAFVLKDNHYGIIDHQGNVVIDFKYDLLKHVHHNQVIAKMDNHYGVIDLDENIIIPFIYDHIKYHHEYYVCKDKLWGCCDFNGKLLIEPIYDELLPLFDEVARGKLGNDYVAVSKEDYILPGAFDYMTICKKDLMLVGIHNRYGYMNSKGELLTPIIFQTGTLPNEMDSIITVSYHGNFYLIRREDLCKK